MKFQTCVIRIFIMFMLRDCASSFYLVKFPKIDYSNFKNELGSLRNAPKVFEDLSVTYAQVIYLPMLIRWIKT